MQPILSATQDPATYVAIMLGGFALLYLSVLRPMMRGKKNKDPLEQQPLRIGLAQQRAIERDMQNLLLEYEKMIRNMTAGVDTRAAKLEVLIKEADEKLAALRAAGAGGENGSTTPSSPAPTVPDVVGEPRSLETREVQPSGPDPRHAEVYALADQGLSAREVARRLGRPNGEIELILALRAGSR
jgi:hypothetical protein